MCLMTGVPGDLDDTELVDMSASYLASGLRAMSAESAGVLCGHYRHRPGVHPAWQRTSAGRSQGMGSRWD
jgi:hypothetical protein